MFVSVIGDSISTFAGYQPAGYAVFYDENRQRLHGLSSVYGMWWAQVNQFLHAYLCVNNAYSGSTVTGDGFPSANCPRRTAALHLPEHDPDIILIYIGVNDFARGVPVKAFAAAYSLMLSQLRQNYPRAWIFCGTLLQTFIADQPDWTFPSSYGGVPLHEYNDAIRDVCQSCGCQLADLAGVERRYETLDGTHPTASGQKTIAESWIACMRRQHTPCYGL